MGEYLPNYRYHGISALEKEQGFVVQGNMDHKKQVFVLAGKKTGKLQRDRAIELYNANPKFCKFCNNKIEIQEGIKPSETKKKNFCGHACSVRFHKPRKIYQADKDCSVCGEKFESWRVSSGNWRQSTRCRECLHYKAKTTPFKTKGSILERAANWTSGSATIRKHAREVYNRYFPNKECAVCGYSKYVEVCHIKSVSDFEDTSCLLEINDISNLIGLCPTHHWELDNNHLSSEDLGRIEKLVISRLS